MLPRTHSLVSTICILSLPLPVAIPISFLSHYVVDVFSYSTDVDDVNIEIITHIIILFIAIEVDLFIILGVVLGSGVDIIDKVILRKSILHLNLKRIKMNRRNQFILNIILFLIVVVLARYRFSSFYY